MQPARAPHQLLGIGSKKRLVQRLRVRVVGFTPRYAVDGRKLHPDAAFGKMAQQRLEACGADAFRRAHGSAGIEHERQRPPRHALEEQRQLARAHEKLRVQPEPHRARCKRRERADAELAGASGPARRVMKAPPAHARPGKTRELRIARRLSHGRHGVQALRLARERVEQRSVVGAVGVALHHDCARETEPRVPREEPLERRFGRRIGALGCVGEARAGSEDNGNGNRALPRAARDRASSDRAAVAGRLLHRRSRTRRRARTVAEAAAAALSGLYFACGRSAPAGRRRKRMPS